MWVVVLPRCTVAAAMVCLTPASSLAFLAARLDGNGGVEWLQWFLNILFFGKTEIGTMIVGLCFGVDTGN